MLNKKGQVSAGLITGLVFGIASLVIGVIIAFVIVSTLTGANLLNTNRASVSVINETTFINSTGDTLSAASLARFLSGSISPVLAINSSSNLTIASGNYTISSAGVITNATAETWNEVKLTYSYTLKNNEEISADNLASNFTAGVDNVSTKIPTVLLVAAIVLILGVLVLLVGAWRSMNIGGGNGGI